MTPVSPPRPAILRILLLEDDPADCMLVRDALEKAGIQPELTIATTRNDFVGALMQAKFALILADYSLPGYDGISALAQARELQPDAPFIFVSGTIGEERAVEILKEGAADCVLKSSLNRLGPSVLRAVSEAHERSGRRQAEAALQASEARFRDMAENIGEVFWSSSADGLLFHYVSPAFKRIWGRPAASLVGNPASWSDSLHAEDKARMLHARQQLAKGAAYDLEYRILQPDGACRWVGERAYPVMGDRGTVERVVGVARDITERRQLEVQLQQAQKMESIGQLAGGIAHDFGNMLTVINGYSNLLLDNPALPASIAEPLRQIYVAGGRAAALTKQLLIFSRKSQPNLQPVDLNEAVTEAATMLRRMIGENIRLELDLARPLPAVLADSSMLEQVLMNLVVNARDAMPRGGSLVVSTGSTETSVDEAAAHPDARPGPHLWLSVRDTGTGIAPEVLPRIFEPFFTTKPEGKGTGLGLATVFGIAKQHQGWVEVESEVGVGTLFRLSLPLAPPSEAAKPPEAHEAGRVKGGQETILLVEDEESVRSYARTVLEMHGYKVLEAGTGVDALETWKWHGERVALLLTDLVLPDEMTGPDLAQKFQAERPALKVVYTSGYNPEAAGPIIKSRDRFHFLQKPYQPKTLARLVREALDPGAINRSPSQAPFG
jgi:two-component system cell cycle sensor histidine kinase/response regulator CckA